MDADHIKGDKRRKSIDSIYSAYIHELMTARLRVAIAIGLILHLCFLPIYWAVYPATFIVWVKIFLVIAVILTSFLILILSSKRVKAYVVWPTDIVSYVNVVALCAIIYLTDGSTSRYYQGINIVFLCYPFVNAFYSVHVIFFYIASIAFYDFCVLAHHGSFNLTDFLFANYYLSSSAIILIFMAKYYSEQHYNAFVRQELLKESIADISRAKEEIEEADKALQQQAEELARSNKDLEQFAYIASHDLQEPLRMVASFCKKLETRYKDKLDPEAHEYIHFAVDGAKRMQALIDALLKYARVGKKDVEKTEVDLNKVLQTIKDDMVLAVKEKSAVINVGPMPVVTANQVQMYQLFQNFVTNALKFKGERNPVVDISAKKNSDGWEFSVSDNGIGIDEAHFSKLFIIFQRLHERDKYPGTGIGLALCKKIVENCGGKVWVKSKVGQGTTFNFTLNTREAGV